VSHERETEYEQIVGDGEVEHERGRRRSFQSLIDGNCNDRQRVANGTDAERHQVQHEDDIPQHLSVDLNAIKKIK
jgi:hypothetical protein